MSRSTAAALGVSFSLLFGCGTTQVQAGVPNAPALGGSPVIEAKNHDAVANGQESCELREEGSPLRSTPFCPHATKKAQLPELVVVARPKRRAVVLPLGYSDLWACEAQALRPPVGRWSIFPCTLPEDDGRRSR